MTKNKEKFDPAVLNQDGSILWFDDFPDAGQEPTNGYRFLSNFYVGDPIVLSQLTWDNGKPIEFMTGEHAFQALKALDEEEFAEILTAPTPGESKRLGRKCTLRADWEAVKLDVMALVVRSKFTLARAEGQNLLKTGDALLTEGTYWGDQVWGVDLRVEGYPGRNWLGTLLMARRAELLAEEAGFKVGDFALHNLHWCLEEH